jgi:peptidyl-prolyl cis-trans isomerase C
MKKKAEILFYLAVLSAFRCGTKIEQSDIIAKVGNAVLTKQKLQSLMVNQGYSAEEERTFVDRWIHRELLYQEALRQHIQQSDDLQKELIQIEKELMINKLLERTYKEKIRFSEEEIRSYYDQNVTDFRVSKDEVRIQHILLKTRSDANLALQEITAGNAFESVAKSRSIDEFAEQGGEMGYVCREDVIPEIQRQAFRLSDNQVSPIIQTEFGFHIIKVLDHRSAGDLRPLAEVRPEIMQRLRVIKEGQVYYDLLYQLQNQNKYYVIQPSLPGVATDSVETIE